MTKNISILHPSWKRPELARQCYDEWVGRCEELYFVEYILCLSRKDPKLGEYLKIFYSTIVKFHLVEDNGLILQVNAAAKQSVGNLLIAVSDDFGCPNSWDRLLLSELHGKKDYLVKTQDTQQPWIITLPIMDRVYYEARDYIYHPITLHMFCDTWITHEAHLMGKVVTLDLVFPHNHYTSGRMKKDEVNVENDSTWAEGERIYLDGVQNNFGVQNPLPITLPDHHRSFLKSKGFINL